MKDEEPRIYFGLIPLKRNYTCEDIRKIMEDAEREQYLSLVADSIVVEHLCCCDSCAEKYDTKLHELMVSTINCWHDMVMDDLDKLEEEFEGEDSIDNDSESIDSLRGSLIELRDNTLNALNELNEDRESQKSENAKSDICDWDDCDEFPSDGIFIPYENGWKLIN